MADSGSKCKDNLIFSDVRYMSSTVSMYRPCALIGRLKFSAMFLRHLVAWPSLTFL